MNAELCLQAGARVGFLGMHRAAAIRFDLPGRRRYAFFMRLDRAEESLEAAQLCLEAQLVNSAASRAYYAMFQAAQVALEAAGFVRVQWSHSGLQATFTTELIHRRKLYSATLRDHLASGLGVRQAADYGHAGISGKVAQRLVRRATTFVDVVREVTNAGAR